jgi:heme exporter protein B
MNSIWAKAWFIAQKDILLELRSREMLTSILVFALLSIVIFNFAFEPGPGKIGMVAPGVLWVTFSFAGVLGLARSFAMEREESCIEGLMLCPADREVIYWGKMLSNFVFMFIMELIILPIFAVFLDQPLFLPRLLLIMFLATLGFAAVGTLFSAMSANIRTREVMLPLLFFPVIVPVLIAAVKSSGFILEGAPWDRFLSWVQMLAAFDAIFIVICSWVFKYTIEV